MIEQAHHGSDGDIAEREQGLWLTINGAGAQTPAAALPATGVAQIIKAIAGVMREIDTVAKRGQRRNVCYIPNFQ